LRELNIPNEQKPDVVISNANELKTLGKYRAITNTSFYSNEISNKEILETEGLKQGDVEFHENVHLKQAIEYKSRGNTIDSEKENKEYIKYTCQKSKKRLDKAGVNAENVDNISPYASKMYSLGRFDEVEAEYMTHKRK